MPQRVILIDVDAATVSRVRALLASAFPGLAVSTAAEERKHFGWDEEDCRGLIEQSPEPIFIYGPGGLLYANAAAAATVGYAPEEVVGRDILEFVHADDQDDVRNRIRRVIGERAGVEPAELRLLHRSGSSRCVEIVSVPVSYGGQPAAQVIGRDVTERRKAEERLRHAALHDALTSLPNRAALLDHLGRVLEAGGGAMVCVAILDLDEFKVVNDTLGHTVGDDVLRRVGANLQAAAGPGSFVARFGGDEFVMVMSGIGSPAAATDAIRRVVDTSLGRMEAGGMRVEIRGSTGVAFGGVAGEPPVDGNELLRRADLALYHAKAEGAGGVALFHPDLDVLMQTRLSLGAAVTDAVHRGLLTAHYQPIVRLSDDAVVGAESLARWTHPELGVVPPDSFIPVAQQSGVGFALDLLMLERACADAAVHPSLSVSVNVSALHLSDPRLVGKVAEVLHAAALPPHRLALEITERDALRQPEVSVRALHELKGLGVALHLDDFGRGHSALSYLERLPVDAVKLDRHFVASGPRGGAVLSALVTLVRAFGLQVVAEGVETAADLEAVRSAGCDYAQGYYISRPVPAEALYLYLEGKHVV